MQHGKVGVLSDHIPHHATIQQVENMLHEWSEAPYAKNQRLVLGLDTNETLSITAGSLVAHTGQGNAFLQWVVEEAMYLPEQDSVAREASGPHQSQATTAKREQTEPGAQTASGTRGSGGHFVARPGSRGPVQSHRASRGAHPEQDLQASRGIEGECSPQAETAEGRKRQREGKLAEEASKMDWCAF